MSKEQPSEESARRQPGTFQQPSEGILALTIAMEANPSSYPSLLVERFCLSANRFLFPYGRLSLLFKLTKV